jgi:hypothetical protein
MAYLLLRVEGLGPGAHHEWVVDGDDEDFTGVGELLVGDARREDVISAKSGIKVRTVRRKLTSRERGAGCSRGLMRVLIRCCSMID